MGKLQPICKAISKSSSQVSKNSKHNKDGLKGSAGNVENPFKRYSGHKSTLKLRYLGTVSHKKMLRTL